MCVVVRACKLIIIKNERKQCITKVAFHLTCKTATPALQVLPLMESAPPTGDFGNANKRCRVCRRSCRRGHVNGTTPVLVPREYMFYCKALRFFLLCWHLACIDYTGTKSIYCEFKLEWQFYMIMGTTICKNQINSKEMESRNGKCTSSWLGMIEMESWLQYVVLNNRQVKISNVPISNDRPGVEQIILVFLN